QYAIKSLSPVDEADILVLIVEEETNSLVIVVKQESLSKAIGKNGFNVRLASSLIVWKIKVLSDAQQEEKQMTIVEKLVEA
ncbi:transcription termination/antitermination protein NusA, partial [Francisella tularensis subsp. holarctica]|nr:transcription termination/antitermination protein NusA [Francisella tularensis subsp. holarctica]